MILWFLWFLWSLVATVESLARSTLHVAVGSYHGNPCLPFRRPEMHNSLRLSSQFVIYAALFHLGKPCLDLLQFLHFPFEMWGPLAPMASAIMMPRPFSSEHSLAGQIPPLSAAWTCSAAFPPKSSGSCLPNPQVCQGPKDRTCKNPAFKVCVTMVILSYGASNITVN